MEMRAPVDRRWVLLQIELVSHNHHRLLQSNEHSEHTLLFSPSTSAISGSHFDSTLSQVDWASSAYTTTTTSAYR